MQFLLQVQQLLAFTLHHTRHRNTRPARYDFCDIISCHLFTHQRVAILGCCQLLLDGLDIIFEDFQFRVADFRHLPIVTLAFGTLSLQLQILHLLLILLDLVDELSLTFPLGAELGLLLPELCDILIQLCNLGLVSLALDSLAFDFKLREPSRNLIEFLRHAVTLHPQLGCCLVHQVDGLIRQEPF